MRLLGDIIAEEQEEDDKIAVQISKLLYSKKMFLLLPKAVQEAPCCRIYHASRSFGLF